MTNKIIEVQNIKVNVTNINDSEIIFVFLILPNLKRENPHQMMLSEIG